MRKWKVLILAGVLLPIITLPFVSNWASQMGLVWNLGNSVVKIETSASSDAECLRQTFRTPSSTPACGQTLIKISYKWILLLGIGIAVYGFIIKERNKGA